METLRVEIIRKGGFESGISGHGTDILSEYVRFSRYRYHGGLRGKE